MARSNALGALREIVESPEGPKVALLKKLGDISKERVQHCQILVAIHPGSDKHAGTSILKSDNALMEDKWQGKVGLVLAVGPGAYQDTPTVKFYGQSVKVGDWVLAQPSAGLELYIREVPCRLFEDVNIRIVVDDPEIYW
jgi:co-chaperonin GroES (HSP10)